MNTLNTSPRQRVVAVATILALAAAVAVWLMMRPAESTMQANGYGIVPYELAFTADKVDTILTAWGSEGQAAARRSLLIDFAFMPSYGILFAGITLLLARQQRVGWLKSVGFALAIGALAAALFDALENVMLLTMLGREGSVPALPPVVAGVAACLKFSLLVLALVYWLGGGLNLLVQRLAGQRA